jgi:hypothetical protein
MTNSPNGWPTGAGSDAGGTGGPAAARIDRPTRPRNRRIRASARSMASGSPINAMRARSAKPSATNWSGPNSGMIIDRGKKFWTTKECEWDATKEKSHCGPQATMRFCRSSFSYLLPQQRNEQGPCERDGKDRKPTRRAWAASVELGRESRHLDWVAACRQMASADVMAITKWSVYWGYRRISRSSCRSRVGSNVLLEADAHTVAAGWSSAPGAQVRRKQPIRERGSQTSPFHESRGHCQNSVALAQMSRLPRTENEVR